MSPVQRSFARTTGTLVVVLMLAGTFAWYFRPGLLMDLSTWLASCVSL